MSLPVVWRAEAKAELLEALNRYQTIRLELALRFAEAVEKTVDAAAETPRRFAAVDRGCRRAGVRRFPYGLYFLLEENRIVVIACFHGKRNPSHWQSR